MSTQAVTSDVAQYAAAVRQHLAGLTPEQVEDLTDDLELDLQDALDDDRRVGHGRTLADLLGTPEAYATDLRTAAGLDAPAPQRARRPVRDALIWPVRRGRELGRRVLATLRQHAWWSPVESFALSLRPVWWVARAWVVYVLVVALLVGGYQWVPHTAWTWLLLGAAVVASVQWGRGSWVASRRTRWMPLVANAVAVVAILPVLSTLQSDVRTARWYPTTSAGTAVEYRDQMVDGVVVDGVQVSNLFVYDAEGNPLSDVQIFDDRGRPVRTTFDEGWEPWTLPGVDEPWQFVGATAEDGRTRWNVYPLRGGPSSQFTYDDEGGRMVLSVGSRAGLPPLPFAKAPAVDVPAAQGATSSGGTVVADGQDGAADAGADAGTPSPQPTGPVVGETSGP
ncbi:hypothetical protein ACFO3K_03270 [Cellulomonas algicola]|uniref:Uncharacterized protein n=1 Tax=Cellulomonas algicola TaxID=2071633 RepID=A0A401UX61_9CELL|nr:hypothetical protein [Cellulomonas algicola]GCD19263.1 hypothetical protein CTKZ_08250 [Cellulomonas algicola]